MPPTKDDNTKYAVALARSYSYNNGVSMSARVYHPATNLMPPSPPLTPTTVEPNFMTSSRSNGYNAPWGRQNSQNGGKYS